MYNNNSCKILRSYRHFNDVVCIISILYNSVSARGYKILLLLLLDYYFLLLFKMLLLLSSLTLLLFYKVMSNIVYAADKQYVLR